MNETGLNVVCKSCGAEVSPYVTECPYCGTRLRKRAPDLERTESGLAPRRSRRERRRERRRQRQQGRFRTLAGSRTMALPILIAVPVLVLLVRIAAGLTVVDLGALVTPGGDDWWRFPVSPFIYGSIGYLFAVSLVLVLFVPGVERRLGTVPTLILLTACGILGVTAAFGIETARGGLAVITGGNGIAGGAIAAWYVTGRFSVRPGRERVDPVGPAIAAATVLLLGLVVDGVSVWAAVSGGAVGALAALVAARAGR